MLTLIRACFKSASWLKVKISSMGSGDVGTFTLDRFASYIASALITVIPADAVFTSAMVEMKTKNRMIAFTSIVIVILSPKLFCISAQLQHLRNRNQELLNSSPHPFHEVHSI